MKLLSHKPYRLRTKGSSLTVTIPKTVLLFTDFEEDCGLWMYATPRGLLLSTQRFDKKEA